MQIIVIVLNVQIFQMNVWREGLQRWVTTTLNFSLQEGGSAPTSPTDSSSNHQNEAQIRTKAVRELGCKKYILPLNYSFVLLNSFIAFFIIMKHFLESKFKRGNVFCKQGLESCFEFQNSF